MTPAVLGGLTSVVQKAAQAQQTANTAQQMAVNASSLATSNATAITAIQAAPALSLTMLSTPMTYAKASLTLDNNWHTLTVPGVPASATYMYIGGYVTNQGATGGGMDNQRQTMLVSPNNGRSSITVSYSNGVAGQYENDSAIGPCFVQCSGPNLYYNWSDPVTDTNFVVYGYI